MPIVHESVRALSTISNIFKVNVATSKILGVDDLTGFMLVFFGYAYSRSDNTSASQSNCLSNNHLNFKKFDDIREHTRYRQD